jgi:hypothetical protein
LERAFLDLLADAGQIGRVKTFAAQEFAHGLGVASGFQINLELFLGAQITPFRAGAFVRSIGGIAAVHVSVTVLDRRGKSWLWAPYGLPASGLAPQPCCVIETDFEVTDSETAGYFCERVVFVATGTGSKFHNFRFKVFA